MDLTHVPTLRDLLTRHDLAPTKRLGQHFLVSRAVVEAILARIAEPSVLEVGPGPGVLTSGLLARGVTVTAVELDPIAVSILRETAPGADVRHEDALQADFTSILSALPAPASVVSNMPYQITGPLLTRFVECRVSWVRAVLMMQREVAEKLIAACGDSNFGSISVYIQTRCEVRRVVGAPAGAFFPPPKVDSSVLELVPKPQTWPPEFDAKHQQIVRAGFAQPRKTLANNLSSNLAISRARCEEYLKNLDLDPRARPHQVCLEGWRHLAEVLEWM